MALDDDVARLARTRPFSLMPREAVQLVAFAAERKRFMAGDVVFAIGDAADCGFFVHSGAVQVAGVGGRERRVGPGALIGETALLAEGLRSLEARAIEASLLLRIPRDTFRRVLIEFPEAAAKIRANLGARLNRLVGDLDATRRRALDRRATPAR